MTAAQMEQLTDNVRRDGQLTSTVLVYQDPESGELELLSGHHRTEAAIGADLPLISAQVITTPLTAQRKTAIQLSHNAISGQDDRATLAQMYGGLDLRAKTYSGLDDRTLEGLAELALAGLGVSIKYQEMHLFFLPEDGERVKAAFDELEKAARKRTAYVARLADFDAFFDLSVAAKTKFQAFNSGIVVRMLIDLALERLAQLEVEETADV